MHGRVKLLEMIAAAKINFDNDPDAQNRIGRVLVGTMAAQEPGKDGGSITALRPDGSEASFSPIYGKGLYGPWAVSVDGNDNIWISNLSSASAGIVQLCGFRTENCPPGMKTGDAISPPGGYVGGGLQMQVDVGIGPAGDVWVTNNWQYWPAALERVDEARSTLGGGQGVVVFYRMAKPVRVPHSTCNVLNRSKRPDRTPRNRCAASGRGQPTCRNAANSPLCRSRAV